ncbi:MAG: tetratricopeptide repeat protein [Omnitrophica WOR_2 bacterium]
MTDSSAPDPDQAPPLKTRFPRIFPKKGGDTISAQVGSDARGVAVGKNIIQIGTLVIPTWPVILLILILVGAGIFSYLRSLGPDKMSGAFNIAVADFGQLDASGNQHSSATGKLLSQRLFEGLKTEFDSLPAETRQNFQPQVWNDSLPLSQKRTRLGIIPGKTPQEREQAACKLASQINAQVVIYGNLPPEGDPAGFLPEYAICHNPALRMDADEIIGSHPLGQVVPSQLLASLNDPSVALSVNIKINSWINSLSNISIGIMYDLLGRPDLALPVFVQMKDQPGFDTEPGSEVIWFFIGRENLWLKHLDDAEAAFKHALGINPDYARARIGLGSAFYIRAQDLAPSERLKTTDMQNALDQYQTASGAPPDTLGALIKPKAQLGLGMVFLLQGETNRQLSDLHAAEASFNKARTTLSAIIPVLTEANQFRLLAQSYQALGNADFQLGQLQELQGNLQAAKPFYQNAGDSYAHCIEQGKAAPADAILADQVIDQLCIPYQKAAEAAYANIK